MELTLAHDHMCLAFLVLLFVPHLVAADGPHAGDEEGEEDQNSEKYFLNYHHWTESDYFWIESYRFMFAEWQQDLTDCPKEVLTAPYMHQVCVGPMLLSFC